MTRDGWLALMFLALAAFMLVHGCRLDVAPNPRVEVKVLICTDGGAR